MATAAQDLAIMKREFLSVGTMCVLSWGCCLAAHGQKTATASGTLLAESNTEGAGSSSKILPTFTICSSKRSTGKRLYKLNDHLGNVRATVSDERMAITSGATISGFAASVLSWSDYYAYGQPLNGRHVSSPAYRYGINGLEKEDEWKGDAAHYTSSYRQLDPRVGRWMSIDPVLHVHQSPYNAFDANPVAMADPSGADAVGGGGGGGKNALAAGAKQGRDYYARERQKFARNARPAQRYIHKHPKPVTPLTQRQLTVLGKPRNAPNFNPDNTRTFRQVRLGRVSIRIPGLIPLALVALEWENAQQAGMAQAQQQLEAYSNQLSAEAKVLPQYANYLATTAIDRFTYKGQAIKDVAPPYFKFALTDYFMTGTLSNYYPMQGPGTVKKINSMVVETAQKVARELYTKQTDYGYHLGDGRGGTTLSKQLPRNRFKSFQQWAGPQGYTWSTTPTTEYNSPSVRPAVRVVLKDKLFINPFK